MGAGYVRVCGHQEPPGTDRRGFHHVWPYHQPMRAIIYLANLIGIVALVQALRQRLKRDGDE